MFSGVVKNKENQEPTLDVSYVVNIYKYLCNCFNVFLIMLLQKLCTWLSLNKLSLNGRNKNIYIYSLKIKSIHVWK